jgi:hypothetical protein
MYRHTDSSKGCVLGPVMDNGGSGFTVVFHRMMMSTEGALPLLRYVIPHGTKTKKSTVFLRAGVDDVQK